MAVNRVDYGGNTLIDLTGDTLESAEQLMKGIIAHARDGRVITGQMESGGGGGSIGDWAIQSGSFTPSENIASNYIITLDEMLQMAPNLGRSIAAFWLDNPPGVDKSNSAWVCSIRVNNVFSQTSGIMSSGYAAYVDAYGNLAKSTALNACIAISVHELKIPCGASKMLIAGNAYRWIALTRIW